MKNLKNRFKKTFPGVYNDLLAYYHYYKSLDLITSEFENSLAILVPSLSNTILKTKSGERIAVPRKYWRSISTLASIKKFGGNPEIQGDKLIIKVGDLTLISSPEDKSAAISVKEIFFEGEYVFNGINYQNKIVVDIGANIGDSSIWFAKEGAKKVYAFEPLPSIQKYITLNKMANNFQNVIEEHFVGLGCVDNDIDVFLRGNGSAGTSAILHSTDELTYESGYVKETLQIKKYWDYLKENGITACDILKMDCEMCEYDLLKDNKLLSLLDPEFVIVEFHDGSKSLSETFINAGYKMINESQKAQKVGLLVAQKAKS